MADMDVDISEAEQVIDYVTIKNEIDATGNGSNDQVTKYLLASEALKTNEGKLLKKIVEHHNKEDYRSVYYLFKTWAQLRVYVIETYGKPLENMNDNAIFTQLTTTIREAENWRLHVATFDPVGTERLVRAGFKINPSEAAPLGETIDQNAEREAELERFASQKLAAASLLGRKTLTQSRQQLKGGQTTQPDTTDTLPLPEIDQDTGEIPPLGKTGKRGLSPGTAPPKKPASRSRPSSASGTTTLTKSDIGDDDIINLVELALDGIDIKDNDDEDDLGEWIPAKEE